ncbi:MAG: hypothetical protein ACOY90_13545 [Candidatus Zhuqueibacterota bacterium]
MKVTYSIILFIVLSFGATFAQTQYPLFFEQGAKIDYVPDVNVYIISESQFKNTLTVNELYKNCEKRVELLLFKIAKQDSIIKLHEAKEANYDSTLSHTKQNLDKTTDELQQARKQEVLCQHTKKYFWGAIALETVIIFILAL